MKPQTVPVLVMAVACASADSPPLRPTALVSALDEQIQLRFLDTGVGFGMSRICGPVGHGALGRPESLRRFPQAPDFVWRNSACGGLDWVSFRPVNSQETWVVNEVDRAKVEIWTMLVSAKQRSLEGPVVLGTESPESLTDIRRQLLARAAKPPISEDPLDNWQVVVKPIRASREACLSCHNQRTWPGSTPALKLGDPLGFAVYLFRMR